MSARTTYCPYCKLTNHSDRAVYGYVVTPCPACHSRADDSNPTGRLDDYANAGEIANDEAEQKARN